jgi:hypothetical protein
MKRTYDSGTDIGDVAMFVGNEIEHTPAFGKRTLFVVGVQHGFEILEQIAESKSFLDSSKHIDHVYFGANHSFKTDGVNDYDTWRHWENMIDECLNAGLWCTLDVDVSEVEGLIESGLCENRRFIPMISVKLPYIELLNYNTTIKIDDYGDTNNGVWCHQLHDLKSRSTLTIHEDIANEQAN